MTKCLENFVSQTLGFITRFCAAELRKYFKQFKKEDHQWRKTWRVRTIAFCLGSVFVTILGIVVMWGILLI